MAKSNALKWTLFGFNAVILVAGLIIVATSLRVLFDPDFIYLLQQHGSFMVGYVLLAVGALMSLVSLYGLASILVERPCLLWVFFMLVLLFVVGEISAGVLIYTKRSGFQERMQNSIRWSVAEYYGQSVGNQTTMDILQTRWQCCGSNSYTSWTNSHFSKRPTLPGTDVSSTFWIPDSCCIDRQSANCKRLTVDGLVSGEDTENVYYHEGCSHKLVVVINTYSEILLGFGAVLVLIQLVTMTLIGVFIHSLTTSGSTFLSRNSRYGSGASEAMLRAESAESTRKFSTPPTFVNGSKGSLNLEPAHLQGENGHHQHGPSSLV